MDIKNNIYFLCEQDGEVEREFKKILITSLETYGKPVRAYLTQVAYQESNPEFNVALCFMTDEREDTSLLHEATEIFRSMFGGGEHLDIIFLNRDQELAIRKISCPFYVSENYQVTFPDFYLHSSEGFGLDNPIACFKRKRLFGKNPNGYLLCDIKPSLIGQRYGLGSRNVNQLVLASRHKDYSIFQINEWPAYVHVAIILSDINDYVSENNVELIAWGELYQRESDVIMSRK